VCPNSLAIIVNLDVTGSMRRLPKIMVDKLGNLMGILIKNGYVQHPHILFAANGDATLTVRDPDNVPIQVGQFESDIRMEDDLSKLFLEGRGGDGRRESYELMMYFYSRHTSIDCFEKRGKKGYLFIIGDEYPYPEVKIDEVQKYLGETIQANIPLSEIADELLQKYDVYVIVPNGSANFTNNTMRECWRDLFGQNVVFLDNPDLIAETIAGIIGVSEGFSNVENGIAAVSSKAVARTVTSSIANISKSGKNIVATTDAKLPEQKPTITELK
jgi:hypothetical protein